MIAVMDLARELVWSDTVVSAESDIGSADALLDLVESDGARLLRGLKIVERGPSIAQKSLSGLATDAMTLQGRSSRLTPKEFDLLKFLVDHANKPIPHRKLLQTVWGPDYGDEVEYLRVVVNQLRKKIEPVPSKPKYLLTEPWVGYRFATSELQPT